jgi:hypothetical protein
VTRPAIAAGLLLVGGVALAAGVGTLRMMPAPRPAPLHVPPCVYVAPTISAFAVLESKGAACGTAPCTVTAATDFTVTVTGAGFTACVGTVGRKLAHAVLWEHYDRSTTAFCTSTLVRSTTATWLRFPTGQSATGTLWDLELRFDDSSSAWIDSAIQMQAAP